MALQFKGGKAAPVNASAAREKEALLKVQSLVNQLQRVEPIPDKLRWAISAMQDAADEAARDHVVKYGR